MERMSVKKPTMRDIAREVGTSAVTVSKAMAGKTGMSDELRMRILKKASEMGYEYPHSSRLLPREHLEIGILIPDKFFEPDSFYAEIYKRLVKKLADRGHFGLLELLDPENERELVLPTLLTTKHVDGLIMLGEPAKAYYRKAAQAGTPVVFLDFYDEQANADAVAGDNTYAASSEPKIWYNKLANGVNDPACRSFSLLSDPVNETIANKSSYSKEHSFYCYPNLISAESFDSTWSPRHTMLVVDALLGGVQTYYPIELPVIGRNKCIIIEELIITKKGSDYPYIPVTDGSCDVSIEVVPWDELTPYTETI